MISWDLPSSSTDITSQDNVINAAFQIITKWLSDSRERIVGLTLAIWSAIMRKCFTQQVSFHCLDWSE